MYAKVPDTAIHYVSHTSMCNIILRIFSLDSDHLHLIDITIMDIGWEYELFYDQ